MSRDFLSNKLHLFVIYSRWPWTCVGVEVEVIIQSIAHSNSSLQNNWNHSVITDAYANVKIPPFVGLHRAVVSV